MEDQEVLRRRVLDSAVSSVCLCAGFRSAETFAIETLSELLVNCIIWIRNSLVSILENININNNNNKTMQNKKLKEKRFYFSSSITTTMNIFKDICQLSIEIKLFAELQNRTEPTIHDVASSFIEFGIDLKSFLKYTRGQTLMQQQLKRVAKPAITTIPKPPPVLHSLRPKQHFNYIHDHFPSFPDPHTYILTQCEVKNDREYQKLRELLAEQKLNMEKNLIRLRLKNELLKYSGKELSIFHEETNNTAFMLIKNKEAKSDELSMLTPYMKALLSNN